MITERFEDAEDLGGVFSGFGPGTGTYDRSSWMYEGGEMPSPAGVREHSSQSFQHTTGAGMMTGEPSRDETLEHPRCVFPILRRHVNRCTPQMVERLCGSSPAEFPCVTDQRLE